MKSESLFLHSCPFVFIRGPPPLSWSFHLCASVPHLWLSLFRIGVYRCSIGGSILRVAARQAQAQDEAADGHPAPAVHVARVIMGEGGGEVTGSAEDARQTDAHADAAEEAHGAEHAEKLGDAVHAVPEAAGE